MAWCLAFAYGDLIHGASRRDRSIVIHDVVVLAFPRIFVAMFDQQPMVRFPPSRSLRIRTSTQLPCSLVAVQREFQVAFLNPFSGSSDSQ